MNGVGWMVGVSDGWMDGWMQVVLRKAHSTNNWNYFKTHLCSHMQVALPVLSGVHPVLSSAHPVLSSTHTVLSSVDIKFMKVCSIILFTVMTLALKVLVMLTTSMGTLFLKSVIFLYGWIPAHMALVTAAAIFMINGRAQGSAESVSNAQSNEH